MYPQPAIDRAVKLALGPGGRQPTAIARVLDVEYPDWAPFSPHTVRNWIANVRRASDEPWDPLKATLEECRLMGPLLGGTLTPPSDDGVPYLGARTSDEWPTTSEVAWMVRVALWFPRATDDVIWELGRYLAASDTGTQQREVRVLAVLGTAARAAGLEYDR